MIDFPFIVPPGGGVHTVHTGREYKEVLYLRMFQCDDKESFEKKWKRSFDEQKKIGLLGIASDCGGGILRGANWGPLFIRNEIYPKSLDSINDLGDIHVIPHLLHDKYLNDETIQNCRQALYGEQHNEYPVSPLSLTEYYCDQYYKKSPESYLIGLGGDHSVSYPLVKSWIKNQKELRSHFAVIHFDAHTDLMKSRLGIDLCFGSWAYHIIEDLQDSKNLIQIGIRSSGKDRDHWETKLQMQQYWSHEVREEGADQISDKIISDLQSRNIENLYISFDIDALDLEYASATGTPEKNGLYPYECVQIIENLGAKFKITGADLVEVAPFIKSPYKSKLSGEPETTLGSARTIMDAFIRVMNA